MSDLANCCGEEPTVLEFRGEETNRLIGVMVGCEKCGKQGWICESAEEAEKTWNEGKQRVRILFMPEGTILGHVGRSLAVADALDPTRWEIRFAASGDYACLVEGKLPGENGDDD